MCSIVTISGAPSSFDIAGQRSTVYVGGLGGYAGPLSAGRPPSFRGCIESLYYNNVNVFHRVLANDKKSSKSANRTPISIYSNKAYNTADRSFCRLDIARHITALNIAFGDNLGKLG